MRQSGINWNRYELVISLWCELFWKELRRGVEDILKSLA